MFCAPCNKILISGSQFLVQYEILKLDYSTLNVLKYSKFYLNIPLMTAANSSTSNTSKFECKNIPSCLHKSSPAFTVHIKEEADFFF